MRDSILAQFILEKISVLLRYLSFIDWNRIITWFKYVLDVIDEIF